jgi:hypothetical protein
MIKSAALGKYRIIKKKTFKIKYNLLSILLDKHIWKLYDHVNIKMRKY